MSWRTINDDDIRSAISEPEDTLFRTRLLAEGQTDPYTAISAQVTSLFRDAIRSNASNKLDPDPATLPEAAIFHATAIIRQRLMTRFSSGVEDETRAAEARAARDYLAAVAKGGCPTVENPDNAAQTKQAVPSPAVNESPRREGWRNQDGI